MVAKMTHEQAPEKYDWSIDARTAPEFAAQIRTKPLEKATAIRRPVVSGAMQEGTWVA
jgi:hypothetical protein